MVGTDVILRTALSIVLFVIAPIIGMLAFGIGRKMSARMQNRFGPPILQPWYDVQKLFTKEDNTTNPLIVPMAFAFFILNAMAVMILVTMGDLLITVVLLGMAQLALALGGFAGSSPYSHVGANRNLLQVLAVEPLVLMTVIGVLIVNDTYFVDDLAMNGWITVQLPMAPVVMLFALVVWMQKGPFDLSTAHQELMYGCLVEYSGKNLALVEIGHWFETFAFLAIFSLFFNISPLLEPMIGIYGAVAVDLVLKMVIAFVALVIVILIDNSTTRLHWNKLPKFAFGIMLPLLFINIIVLEMIYQWGWF